jgi:hypothetical protein
MYKQLRKHYSQTEKHKKKMLEAIIQEPLLGQLLRSISVFMKIVV